MTLSIFVVNPSGLLTDHRPHGDGLVAHGFIQALAERGHELHVAARQVALRRSLPSNAHLHVIGTENLPEPLSRLQYMRKLRHLFTRLGRQTRFDLVHQLNPVDAGLTLALADTDLPVVLGPYVPAWPLTSDSQRKLIPRLLEEMNGLVRGAQQRRATTVLLSTPAAAAKLRQPTPEGLLVRELSPGVDAQLWSPSKVEGHGQDVLFLANLELRKGVFVLLEAFGRLSGELPGSRLIVAGDGSEADAVRREVERSSALSRVELVGRVPRERVPGMMRACSVYCLPSLGEPFGMSALEAMACGKPVVATDAGGLRHLVDDEGGRRVPTGDPRALAAALREVLTAPELQRQMGRHNRSSIEERYTWTRVIDRLEEAYGEAIDAARARRRWSEASA